MSLDTLIAQIKRHEGLVLKPYRDTMGLLTIGYGRNLDANGIDETEAEFLLLRDIENAYAQLSERFPWTEDLDDVRRHVFVNMVFNMGIEVFSQFKRTLAAAQEGRFSDCADYMLESKWASQVGRRAVELAEMMRSGVE